MTDGSPARRVAARPARLTEDMESLVAVAYSVRRPIRGLLDFGSALSIRVAIAFIVCLMYQFFAVGYKVASIRAAALPCLMVFQESTQGPSTTPGSPSVGDVLIVILRLTAVSVLRHPRASSLARMTAAKGGLLPHDRIA